MNSNYANGQFLYMATWISKNEYRALFESISSPYEFPLVSIKKSPETLEQRKERLRVLANHGRKRAW